MTPMVEIAGVTKAFGTIRALSGVSMVLSRNSIHALVGVNAAGKSTLIRTILGLETPDAGSVRTEAGAPLRIGYQPQTPALYDYLTVGEFLHLAAMIGSSNAPDAIDDVMAMFNLTGIESQLVHTTSVGTKMKLAIAAALVQHPDLIVLDEPTNALDAIAVARLKARLRTLRGQGATVLLATHMLDFAEDLCDDVTVLRAGRVEYTGPVGGIGDPAESLESRLLPLLGAD